MAGRSSGAVAGADGPVERGVTAAAPVEFVDGAVTIEAKGLSKRLGTTMAVRDLTFVVHAAEVVGLLGPNGAGKTTTIRLLSTVLTPTSGEFAVAGVPGTRPADIRRRIGVLPESAGYPGHLTGREYLTYHARLLGLTKPEAVDIAARLLDEVGLADRAGTRIATYSRGMRQRLGIARSLVNEPVALLLDEPTLGLDPAGQDQVLALVLDVARTRGTTVMLSTHNLPDVEQVCSRVLVLDRGELLVSGSTSEITRTTAVARSGLLRVPPDQVGLTRRALDGVAGLAVQEERPGVLAISVAAGAAAAAGPGLLNTALRAVLDAEVSVLSFEAAGSRLSDAFLTLTAGERE